MPSVISDRELTTGLTKASPVVIPDKMPMTTLNLDLELKGRTAERLHLTDEFRERYDMLTITW